MTTYSDKHHCSFCGLEASTSRKLVPGHSSFICCECVDLVVGILVSEHGINVLPTVKELSEDGTFVDGSGNRVAIYER